MELYCKAAEQGDSRAQCNLGRICQYGNGVIQKFVPPHVWFNLASTAQHSREETDKTA